MYYFQAINFLSYQNIHKIITFLDTRLTLELPQIHHEYIMPFLGYEMA